MEIQASVNGAGIVSGDTLYTPGDVVTLCAIAEEGYGFQGWYENGELVSTDALYSFTATGSRAFVARFLPLPTSLELEQEYLILKPEESVNLAVKDNDKEWEKNISWSWEPAEENSPEQP